MMATVRNKSDFTQIRKLLALCEKSNVSKMKCGIYEIEFFQKESSTGDKKIKQKKEDSFPSVLDSAMPPDDVMLFAATPHFEKAMAKKGK
jgi:hypothetical protein